MQANISISLEAIRNALANEKLETLRFAAKAVHGAETPYLRSKDAALASIFEAKTEDDAATFARFLADYVPSCLALVAESDDAQATNDAGAGVAPLTGAVVPFDAPVDTSTEDDGPQADSEPGNEGAHGDAEGATDADIDAAMQADAQADSEPDSRLASGERRASNSAGVAASWLRPDVRAARLTKHNCIVQYYPVDEETGERAEEPVQEGYRSVFAAFVALGLPEEKHIPFRKKVKAQKGAFIEFGTTGYFFSTPQD